VPGGEHVHDHRAEHFEVRSGRIALVLDGEQRVLEAGEQLTVSRGTWHRWWNPGEDEVLTSVRVEPALRFQEAILVFWGLCADGHANREGGRRRCSAPCSRATAPSCTTDSRRIWCRG
jgi:hypothetical protein